MRARHACPAKKSLGLTTSGEYVELMPQIQVDLPDHLYVSVKERGLSPADLLQAAIRDELRRQELNAETDKYLAELIDEVGEPSEAAMAKAEALVSRIRNGGTGEAIG